MVILIWLLTIILVLTSLFLILLVLVQLPKKEAGGGLAFGGAATDALIGAGSGNALTNMTKYAGCLFLTLAIILTVLNTQRSKATSSQIDKALQRRATTATAAPAALPAAQTKAPAQTGQQLIPLTTNAPLQPILVPTSTNLVPAANPIAQPAPAPAATLQSNPSVQPSAVGAPALKNPGTPAAEPPK